MRSNTKKNVFRRGCLSSASRMQPSWQVLVMWHGQLHGGQGTLSPAPSLRSNVGCLFVLELRQCKSTEKYQKIAKREAKFKSTKIFRAFRHHPPPVVCEPCVGTTRTVLAPHSIECLHC